MTTATADLLARFDRPGPRYTSYPTAPEFHEGFGPEAYAVRLREAASSPDRPLALYVHLPFCGSRCAFCGCQVVVARDAGVADAYLDRVEREAALLARHLGERRRACQLHWGGGTPTSHSPARLRLLQERLSDHFTMTDGAELAAEVDPRVTTAEHLATLRDLSFNRLSMGVQDADPTVQAAIGRHQTWEQTVRTFESARALGFASINIDLVYGLPLQDERGFAETVDRVARLRPDRLAVYSFAHVPWVRPNQRSISPASLPDRDTKYRLLAIAVDGFAAEGYHRIGMDHFALPHDPLAVAEREATLTRTFMGYTTIRDTDTVALGMSGISDVAGAYAQNHKRLASYYAAVDAGRLPTERGCGLSTDDLVRRHVITELMCNLRVTSASVAERFGIDFATYFARELERLREPDGLVDTGLACVDGTGVLVTEQGRGLLRNVAMVFDAYLPDGPTATPMFSRTV